MLLMGHIALAAWTPRHAALAVYPASRSRPVIAAAEVSVATAAEVRRDESAGPKPKAGAETGDNEAEKYGKDPRPSLASGEPAAGWVVPATGSLGKIANVPELDAALAAAEGRSKVVVVKFFAPWCTSCKAIESRFARTARVNGDAADFYSVDFSTCKPYCKASGIKFMPVAHIYADGVLQDAMPLGAKVYGKFPKRLGQISAASGGESGGESDGESEGNADADVVTGPEPLGL
jgi:thiol-disulfide isomerase/thioredoxin